MLEPRRLATRAAARRMAHLLGEEVGETVGYQTRDERRIGRRTRLEVVTEGVLTRRLQNDATLPGVGLVVFDEVHERNLPTDLGLALTLDVAGSIRPDLRVLAMSATPDTERLAAVLGGAPVIASTGRQFDVDVRWVPRSRDTRLEPAMVNVVQRALVEESGDVLAFLPGVGEISRTLSALRDVVGSDVDLYPLAGALDARPAGRRARRLTGGSPTGGPDHRHRRDVAHGRGGARRGRQRTRTGAALRCADRHDAAHDRVDEPGVGRPTRRARRPNRPGCVLPAVEQARARHPPAAPSGRDHRGRPRRTRARARRMARRTRAARVHRPPPAEGVRRGQDPARRARCARPPRPAHRPRPSDARSAGAPSPGEDDRRLADPARVCPGGDRRRARRVARTIRRRAGRHRDPGEPRRRHRQPRSGRSWCGRATARPGRRHRLAVGHRIRPRHAAQRQQRRRGSDAVARVPRPTRRTTARWTVPDADRIGRVAPGHRSTRGRGLRGGGRPRRQTRPRPDPARRGNRRRRCGGRLRRRARRDANADVGFAPGRSRRERRAPARLDPPRQPEPSADTRRRNRRRAPATCAHHPTRRARMDRQCDPAPRTRRVPASHDR